MKKPTDEEMETAMNTAERMRDLGVDPHRMAHCLLYLQQRNGRLEEVLRRTERYVRFGLAEQELAQLRRLIQQLREEQEHLDDADLDGPSSMLL